MKKLLIVLGVLAALLIVAIAVVPLLINGERFRPMLEAQATKALGRETRIGSLDISLLSGGAKAGDLAIGDDPAFSSQPFLTAKDISIGVELMPLIFNHKLNITGITIQQPQVRLVQNAKGVWNYASLGAKSAAAPEAAKAPAQPEQASAPLNLSVQQVKIAGGRVQVAQEGQQAKPLEVDDVNVTVGPLAAASAIPLQMSLKVAGGGAFTLTGQVGPPSEQDATLTPFNLKTTIKQLDLAHSGLLGPNPAFAGITDFDGTLTSDGRLAQVRGRLTSSRARFAANAPPTPEPIALDIDNARYDLLKHEGFISGMALRTGAAAAQISGRFNLAGETPTMDMHLAGNGMPVNDLAALLPSFGVVLPQGAKLEGGTLKVDLKVTGTATHPLGVGSVEVNDTKLAGFDLASQMRGLSSLAGLKSSKDTAIKLFHSDLDEGPAGLKLTNLKLNVPEIGEISGAGTVSPKNELDFQMVANVNSSAGAIGGMAKLTGGGTGQGGIPFKINGTAENPHFVPDMGRYVKNQFAGAKSLKPSSVPNSVKGLGKMFGKQK